MVTFRVHMLTDRLPAVRRQPRRWRVYFAALAAAAGLLALLILMVPSALTELDERAGAFFWRAFPAQAVERRMVVVDIDEASLAEIGPWPWPRERIAELVRGLGALGANLQVFDIVFSDARPGDDVLAKALSGAPAVLAQILVLEGDAAPAAGRVQGALDAPACAPPLPEARGHLGVAPGLAAAAGHITPRIAADGAVRGVPALICYRGRAYPTLALAALLRAAELPPALTLTPGAGLLDPDWRLGHAGLPGMYIPLDARGDWRVSYRLARSAFASVSAADVIKGRAPAELIRGAWVLVGATAFGIADAVPTALGGAVSGVEVHAQLIAALLDGRSPYTPRGALGLQAVAAGAAIALLLLLAGPRGRRAVVILPLAGVALAGLAFALQGALLLGSQIWLGGSLPAACALFAGLALAIAEHAATRRERELVYRNLSSYLPAAAAAEIAYRAPLGVIDARREQIVALYADLRNFSAWCEKRPPEEAATILHLFFGAIARIVEEEGGIVQEYAGDAVLAVWPGSAPNIARALAAARRVVADVGAALPAPPEDLEPLAVGVGIEHGRVLVGSFGPAARRNYTALGEPITVAIRLQALTAELAEPVLLGPSAAGRLPAAVTHDLGSFLLEGLVEPRHIFGARPVGKLLDLAPRRRLEKNRLAI